jgi:hypothetical protein
MTDRTIVGWDGSPEADVALEWAVERAAGTYGPMAHGRIGRP